MVTGGDEIESIMIIMIRKTFLKILPAVILVVISSGVISVCGYGEAYAGDHAISDGWRVVNGERYYYKNGIRQTGWLALDDGKYYFDKEGHPVSGFFAVGQYTYYFDNDTEKLTTGWIHQDGESYFADETGRLAVGFKTVDDRKYYFDPDTKAMIKGWLEDNNGKYYFGRNGQMYTGLKTIEQENYYFDDETGIMKTGWIEYKKDKYYFDKKGRMVRGLKKIKKYYYYFNEEGRLAKEKVDTDKKIFFADKKSGKIEGLRLKANTLCQKYVLPSGCEIVSWTMMANFAGVDISMTEAADIMPRSGNPDEGFMGNPYEPAGMGEVIYPKGMMKMTKKYLGSAVDMTGFSIESIEEKLFAGHVVIAWVGGVDGFQSHTVALVGYDQEKIYYNDPWTGKRESADKEEFENMWMANAHRALSW